MAITIAELKNIITADISGLQSGAAQAETLLKNVGLSANAMSLVSVAAFGAVVGAIAAVGKAAFDAAVEFDSASDKIRISTGAIGNDLAALEGSFKTVFTSIPTSAASASQAISFLSARLGETGPTLEKLATTELELARITGSALGPQLETTTRLFKDWDIATAAQSGSLDFLFKVSQKTAVGVTTLSQELVKFGAPLRLMGFSFEQAAVLVGKFQAEGVVLEKVLPGLRIQLSKMADEGVTNATEAFKKLIDQIHDAPTQMDAVGLAIDAFGKRAGPDMAEAIRQGRFSIDELMKTIADSHDTITKAAQDTDDFAEKWTTLKNKASAALEPLGKVMFDSLTAVIVSVTEQGNEISKRWDKVWAQMNSATADRLTALMNLFNGVGLVEAAVSLGLRMGNGFIAGFDKAGVPGRIASIIAKATGAVTGLGGLFDFFRPNAPPSAPGMNVPGLPSAEIQASADAYLRQAAAAARARENVTNHGNAHRAATPAIREATKALTEQELLLKAVNDAMKNVVDGINATFRNLQVGNILHDKIIPVVAELTTKAKALAEEGFIKVGQALDDLIGPTNAWATSLEPIPARILDTSGGMDNLIIKMAAAQKAVQDHAAVIAQLSERYVDASRSIPESWNIVINAVLGLNGKMSQSMLELGIKVKEAFGGIEQVVANLPGKFGDSLRNAASEFQRWFATINGILHTLHQVFNSIPDGLGAVLKSVVASVKGSSEQIQSVTSVIDNSIETIDRDWSEAVGVIVDGSGQVSGAMRKMGTDTEGAVNQFTAALGVAASSIGAFITGGQIGGVKGMIFGGLQGVLTGLPFGIIPGIIGGLAGFFGGLFGGGKSSAQKEQEKLQLQQLRNQVQQGAQDIVNAAIDGFNKAMEFFNNLDEFTAPRKAKFQEFWKAMTRLMDGFVALAKVWSNETLTQAKALADNMTPIAQALAAFPNVLTEIGNFLGVSDASFDSFFAALDALMTRFFARSEQWMGDLSEVSHRAKKAANRLGPIADLFGPLIEGFKSLADLKPVADSTFDILDNALNTLVTRLSVFAEKWDKALLKSIENFSNKISPAVDLWKNAVDALKSMVDIPTPTKADFDALFDGIEQAINGMIALSGRITTDGLTRAGSIATASLAIFNAMKTAVEALGSLKDYVRIPAETFQALLDNFEQAINTMLVGIAMSERFISIAKTFEDNIKDGAAHLANAVSIFVASIKNLGFGLAAFGVTVSLPVGVGTTSGGFAPSSATGGFGTTAPTGGFGPSARLGGTTHQVINVTLDPTRFRDINEMYRWFRGAGSQLTSMFGVNGDFENALSQQS